MNILNLFGGISCGQVAINRLGIKNYKYFSSEIDKYAIQITQKNYPNTIQLGNIEKILYRKGKLYSENGDFNIGNIDLLMGGSPCQGFSFAGKQLNFNDPRSALFFEFVRLLEKCKPKWFLLENVVMKKEYQDIISSHLGVKPIILNSALVSAQNRRRLYWTNIKVDILNNSNIVSSDILVQKYYPQKWNPYLDDTKTHNFINIKIEKLLKNSKYKKKFKWKLDKKGRILVMRPDGLKIQRIGRIAMLHNKTEIITVLTQPHIFDGLNFRKLTPIECERLQTLPDNYTEGISNTQRYKCIGNGWTVDVITHILKNIKE